MSIINVSINFTQSWNLNDDAIKDMIIKEYDYRTNKKCSFKELTEEEINDIITEFTFNNIDYTSISLKYE